MSATSRRALRELDRRRALARALWYENQLPRYAPSAESFIRRLPDGYKSILSRSLGVEEPYGILDAMKTPSLWHWSVLYRLCLWGWSPDTDSNETTASGLRTSGDGPAGDDDPDNDLKGCQTVMPPLRIIDIAR